MFPSLRWGEPLSFTSWVAPEADFGVCKSAGAGGTGCVRGGSGPSRLLCVGLGAARGLSPRGRGGGAMQPWALLPGKCSGRVFAARRGKAGSWRPPRPGIFGGGAGENGHFYRRRPPSPLPPPRAPLGRGRCGPVWRRPGWRLDGAEGRRAGVRPASARCRPAPEGVGTRGR